MNADGSALVTAPTMVAADRRETRRYLLLLLPALLTLGTFFVYPLFGILLRSVYKNGYTLESYRQIVRTSVYLTVIGLTFRTAAMVTLIALLLGYPLAYVLATIRPRLARVLVVIVVLPFLTSIIVRTYAWMVLLGRNGVVNQYLVALGLTQAPLPLLYNQAGVVVGMTYVLLPFMVLTLASVMRGIDPALVRAAHSLGASRWQAFRRVFLPLIEREVEFTLNWSFASALGVILLALTLIGFTVYYRLMRLERLFEGLG